MSWIDGVFALLLAGMTAFGAHRRLTGLWVGVGGVLLLRPVLGLAAASPWVGLAAALGGGVLLGLVGRHLFVEARTGRVWQRVLGGLGGASLGAALVLAIAVSLPIQRSPFDPNQLYYPPRDLPPLVQGAVLRSWTMDVGRDVLLFPLLDAQNAVPEERRALLRGLHRLLVVGRPWRQEGG
ncbi:MAG: hypothetical protein U5K81_06760 [Trueperaceae bacterium]|nr:hypothetical protein [Trueperaceae bacterium]